MARRLRPITPLSRAVLSTGRPAYVHAAEVGINYMRLLDYCNGRVRPSLSHAVRLGRHFDLDPRLLAADADASVLPVDAAESQYRTVEPVAFPCVRVGLRVATDGDVIASVVADRRRQE